MNFLNLSENSDLIIELGGLAALQWQLTLGLRARNARIDRYMSDVQKWARCQTVRSDLASARQPDNCGELKIQLACEGIAKILFFLHENRLVIFWLSEFLREGTASPETVILH